MISYPNQKKYHINKKIKEGDIFIMLKWEDYTAAARELSPSALNLFMYLAKNQDKYELWFSSKDYCETFGVTDKTFRNARHELISRGYLKEGDNNHVYFDTSAAYKETVEDLKQRLEKIGGEIRALDADSYQDLYELIKKENLRDIKDETLYKTKIKAIIRFAEDILKDIGKTEFSKLL